MSRPTELDPNQVDADLNPGLRIPEEHDEEVITEATKDGDREVTISRFTELAEVDAASWRPGNPDWDGTQYGLERFRIRFKIVGDSINKDRRVADQFLDFHMGLSEPSYDSLKAIKENAPKGTFERKLPAKKYETQRNFKFMTSLLRAMGLDDVLSSARRNFYGFAPLMDAGLLEKGGELMKGIPVKITIEKGHLNYKGEAITEVVTKVEGI